MRLSSIVVAVCLASAAIAAQQSTPSPEQTQAILEKGRPGPEHAKLAALAGRWRREVTMTMGGGQTMKATGTAVNRMLLGGRFLQSDHVTTVAAGGQMPAMTIEAVTIYGFDRRVSEFTVLELDSMGTYWVTASGGRGGTPAIVMAGETLDDHGGAREIRRYDMVLRIVDADTYVTEIVFKFPNRPPLPLVVATHRRVK
jgi:hypothetical protein